MTVCSHPDCGKVLGSRNLSGLCHTHSRVTNTCNRRDDIPEGFAEVAATMSIRALSRQFKASVEVCTRWRKSLGLASAHYQTWEADDAFLRANYGVMPANLIAASLNRSLNSVKTRAKKLGLQSARKGVFVRRETHVKMMAGHEGEAAYLQRFGAIFRCHRDGTPSNIGACWYWAGKVLSHDEMERAARNHRERRELLAA